MTIHKEMIREKILQLGITLCDKSSIGYTLASWNKTSLSDDRYVHPWTKPLPIETNINIAFINSVLKDMTNNKQIGQHIKRLEKIYSETR